MAQTNCPLSNFAVCAPDPNRGIRMQARLEKRKKDNAYHSASLKYWNRETKYVRGKQRIAAGKSRARSDVYQTALYTLGQGRRKSAARQAEAGKISRVSGKTGVSRTRQYGLNKFKAILDAQTQIENSIDSTFGRNMALKHRKIDRYRMKALAKNRAALGTRPEYGLPVLMPPKDKQGQFWNSVSMGLGLASSAATLGALVFASDVNLKDNIEEVGRSPDGYTIYEWNYLDDETTRYRGVIAQDVLNSNPMAVEIIDHGFLGVDYNKVDVTMEVV